MNKERPGKLNKKIKRLKKSRDKLKSNTREKALKNKKLHNRNVEITESRDRWKACSKEIGRQNEELEQQAQADQKEIEAAHKKAEAAQEQTEAAQKEIETAHKKAEAAQEQTEAAQKETEAAHKKAEAVQKQVEAAQRKAKAAQKKIKATQKQAEADQKEIKALKKEAKKARRKAKKGLKRADELQAEVKALQGKKSQEIENLIPEMGEKAPRGWYPIFMMYMCISMVSQGAISFRAVPKAILIGFSQIPALKDQRVPSYKSIARWLAQIGLYKLNCPKEQANDWALFADYSIQIGTQKCLVILGARLNTFQGKALTFEDMEILAIEIHEKSNAEIVCKALETAQSKIGKAVMVCADDGSDLRKGIALFCNKHGVGRVWDITHKIGTFLKKIFKKDPEWQAFSSATAEAKNKMQQTQAAHLAPPNQRTKSRFLNIETLVGWGIDVMVALETPDHPDKELLEQYCSWVRQYKDLLERLKQYNLISQNTRQYIREHGLCATTGELLDAMLDKVLKPLDFNEEACQYAGKLIDFAQEQSKIIPAGQVWMGSSEVIESVFGKLKSLEQDQSKGGFTPLVLGIAACIGKIDADIVKAAMTQVKTKDVTAWRVKQIGRTLLSKRREALGAQRKKKSTKEEEQELGGVLLGEAVGFY